MEPAANAASPATERPWTPTWGGGWRSLRCQDSRVPVPISLGEDSIPMDGPPTPSVTQLTTSEGPLPQIRPYSWERGLGRHCKNLGDTTQPSQA